MALTQQGHVLGIVEVGAVAQPLVFQVELRFQELAPEASIDLQLIDACPGLGQQGMS